MIRALLVCCFTLLAASTLLADGKDGRLDIYFIDVEGGAATLLVTPANESLLIDSGYPDNGGRDRDRILDVIRNVAKLDHLDHAAVSHWHLDHYGNHAALADKIKINNFWDRGIPETLSEDNKFGERMVLYRAASQNQSKTVKAGDTFMLESPTTPLHIKVVTASGEVIPNEGQPNPFASQHKPQADDPTDNAKSVSLLMTFGKFRFLTCGDLTWNTEAKLMTPNNPVGQVDLFMVTHHGLNVSNNPVMVLALDPRVAVSCNGPTKGGAPETIARVL
ncbi:MAG: MBL fold metallo-hydrolase, partial [Planctomycetota bacterium]